MPAGSNFERTHCHLHIFRLNFDRSTGTETVNEHRLIAEALTAGDGDAAEQAMRAHLHAAMAVRMPSLFADGPLRELSGVAG